MKNKNVVTGFAILIGVMVLVSLIGFFLLKPKPLVLQGEVEVTEVRVSGKVSGRISRFFVKVG
ncbi:MAG: HlyD family secretion protein, partial [Prevotellaceae bacterium]|nr:HlyD family secretion protein [Prevotellaceae bacterium]